MADLNPAHQHPSKTTRSPLSLGTGQSELSLTRRLTFPVLGLLIGHPDQSPQYKPRLPLSVTVADNTYPCLDSYEEALAEYDQTITEYYDLRDTSKRVESFSTLVRTKVGIGGAHVSDILGVIHKQGFDL